MKTLQEEIRSHIPCEVCGNDDVMKFRLRGTIRNGEKSLMIKCDECEEVYPVKEEDK